jgi:uncharacterized caspase-like protein
MEKTVKKIIFLIILINIIAFAFAGIVIGNPEITVPNTFIIAIGIDKFSETNWNLNFCVNDAVEIYNSFPSIPQENKYLLTNETATKIEIEQTIKFVAKKMDYNDTLIVFVATHGFFNNNDFYFTPHDFKFDNMPNKYTGDTNTGFSSNWMLEIFYDKVKNNSNNIVLILDTCHSGSMGFDIRRAYNEDTRNGLALLYSCSPLELSFENISYGGGHGLFSYCIIEGLTGLADKNNDGIITFRELFDYTYYKVKELSDDKQNPVFIGAMKNDSIIKLLK